MKLSIIFIVYEWIVHVFVAQGSKLCSHKSAALDFVESTFIKY